MRPVAARKISCAAANIFLSWAARRFISSALLFGLFDGPPADEHLRSRLLAEADSLGPGVLHERLAAIDPLAASRLHPNDLRRIVRALEVFELTGQPISAWQQQWQHSSTVPEVPPGNAQPGLPAILWLDLPRPLLYDRINRRVEQMFAAGMVDEVQNLEKGANLLATKPGKRWVTRRSRTSSLDGPLWRRQ